MNNICPIYRFDPSAMTSTSGGSVSATPSALCPDLLRYEQIGQADNLRGRVVRGFFWLMRFWPTP